MPKRCEREGCSIRSFFNVAGSTKARFCANHKEPGMVNVVSKRCEREGCDSQPTFNVAGSTKVRFCASHKEPGMVNVKNKRCEREGCGSQPTFNVTGATKARFCASHKEPGMVDIKNKRCEQEGCNSQPAFNVAGSTKARYCASHKEPGMVDVKHVCCEQEGCNSRPVFNVAGSTKARYCVSHKEPGMMDVVSKRCEQEGCNSRPSFNVVGSTKTRFCASHKEPGMIDVENKSCKEGCATRARYGLPGHMPNKCARHRKVGMMTKPRAGCSETEPKCRELATHEVPATKLRYCEEHALGYPTAVDVVQRICAICGLLGVLSAGSMCETCDPAVVRRATGAKEDAVKAFLDAQGLQYLSHDKMVDRGECFKYRPDFLFDAGTHFVVLEVDEHQHMSYACACEQARMVNIAQALGMRTLFLRYNPDAFLSGSGGGRAPTSRERLQLLREWLEWSLRPMDAEVDGEAGAAFCSACYMFYDGWNASDGMVWHNVM